MMSSLPAWGQLYLRRKRQVLMAISDLQGCII
jgi:hypothetical protein